MPKSRTGASPEAIQAHYDLSNDFFKLFLGKTMAYSCAFWRRESYSLDEAQFAKFDLLNEFAGVQQGMNVLDLGCGWGGNLHRLVTEQQVGMATGITLSQAQYEFIQETFSSRKMLAKVENWLDHVPKARYDAMVSIGAFEHFSSLESSKQKRIEGYQEFFSWAAKSLNKNSMLGLQTFAYGEHRDRAKVKLQDGTDFFSREIFT